jgi:hypothetical protein
MLIIHPIPLPSHLPNLPLTLSVPDLKRFTLLDPRLTNYPTDLSPQGSRLHFHESRPTMEMYSSQEATIARRAREKGISIIVLTEYFEKKVQEVEHLYVSRSADWRLGCVEYLVWTRFCKSKSQIKIKQWLGLDLMTPSSQ